MIQNKVLMIATILLSGVGISVNGDVQISGYIIYSFLGLIAVGIWRVAVILTDIRNDLGLGGRTMSRHGKLLSNYGGRLTKLDGQTDPILEETL